MLLIMNGWRKKLSYLFGQAHFVEIPYELCYVLCYLLHLLPAPQMGSNGGSNLMDHLPHDVQ